MNNNKETFKLTKTTTEKIDSGFEYPITLYYQDEHAIYDEYIYINKNFTINIEDTYSGFKIDVSKYELQIENIDDDITELSYFNDKLVDKIDFILKQSSLKELDKDIMNDDVFMASLGTYEKEYIKIYLNGECPLKPFKMINFESCLYLLRNGYNIWE